MKKLITIILFAGIIIPQTFASATQEENKKAEVYYFHNTKRCETCLAIEEETKNALIENFPTEMKDGAITFQVYNFDDSENEEIINKLHVGGQALIIVKNGKQVDLIEKGMLYARTDAEKFKQIIAEIIGN